MEDNALLRVSFYYAANGWKELLTALQQFLHKHHATIRHYLLFPSNEKGDAIRLVLLVRSDAVAALQHSLELAFTAFYKLLPSVRTTAFNPGEDLWMPYDNNSIQFNNFSVLAYHYSRDPAEFARMPYLGFSQQLSALIIDGFINDNITDDSVLSAGLYLQILLSKTLTGAASSRVMSEVIDIIGHKWEVNHQQQLIRQVLEQAEIDYATNSGMIDECMRISPAEELDTLTQAMLQAAHGFIHGGLAEQALPRYKQLVQLTGLHLGITPRKQIYLLHMLRLHFVLAEQAPVNT